MNLQSIRSCVLFANNVTIVGPEKLERLANIGGQRSIRRYEPKFGELHFHYGFTHSRLNNIRQVQAIDTINPKHTFLFADRTLAIMPAIAHFW